MTNSHFRTVVLALRDSTRAGTISATDSIAALRALCASQNFDFEYWFQWSLTA